MEEEYEIKESDAPEIKRTFDVPVNRVIYADGLSVVMPGKTTFKIGFFDEVPGSDHGVGRLHRTNLYVVMPTARLRQSLKILQDALEEVSDESSEEEGKEPDGKGDA